MARAVEHRIEYSRKAELHLRHLTKRQQLTVIEAVDEQLVFRPTSETRHRKRLRANPLAPWELRVGDLRVFYQVTDDPGPLVQVLAVGLKIRNSLLIGDETVDL